MADVKTTRALMEWAKRVITKRIWQSELKKEDEEKALDDLSSMVYEFAHNDKHYKYCFVTKKDSREIANQARESLRNWLSLFIGGCKDEDFE